MGDFPCLFFLYKTNLRALRMPTALAVQAAFFKNEAFFITTIGTQVILGFCAIRNEILQGSGHAIFPGVDVRIVQVQIINQMHHLDQGHAMPNDTRDQFGIIPVFLIEGAGEPLDGHTIPLAVHITEVVAALFLRIPALDDPTGIHKIR